MPTTNPTNLYYTGDGSTVNYAVTFPYIDADYVKATVDGEAADFTLTSPTILTFDTAPAEGTTIRIYRETPDTALVDWVDGAVILGRHLNQSQTQSLHIAQEAHDYAEQIAEEAKQFALDSIQDTVDTALAAAVSDLEDSIDPQLAAAEAAQSAAEDAQTAAEAARDEAQGYASDLATAVSAAEDAADEAEGTLADFQQIYLGAFASDPLTDNEGNPLIVGALYRNTTAGEMRSWNGTSWEAAYIPSSSSVSSWNGRTGAVTPTTGDYAVAHITGLQTALDDIDTRLDAAEADIDTKADDAATTAALATKADDATVTAALATKADDATVTAALATKQDASSNLDGWSAIAPSAKEDADADILKADVSDDLAVGYTATSLDKGTKSSGTFTPDMTERNVQHFTNDGSFTLAPPTGHGSMILDQTNGSSAGTITRTGFTMVTGDDLDTTEGNKFRHFITVGNGGSHIHTQALQ